ncbi:MAG: hypothetical protein AB4080_12275 [Trichodesmium sp.]
MQETQKTELFSDLSTEESATINGGYFYDCDDYGYGRSVSYYHRPVSYHYRSYSYSRPVSYGYGYYDCY